MALALPRKEDWRDEAIAHVARHHGITDEDAHIVFARRFDKAFPHRSTPVLSPQIPTSWDHDDPPMDAFFTMNQFFCPWRASRRSDLIRYIPAVWVDFDTGDGITPNDVLQTLIADHIHDDIPLPSYTVRSSETGIWAVWLIHHLRAWFEVAEDHRGLLRHLAKRYANLGADAKSTDPARLTRVPGTLHPSGYRVHAHWISDERYDYEDLAAAFGYETMRVRKAREKENPKKKKRNAKPKIQTDPKPKNENKKTNVAKILTPRTLAYRRVQDLYTLHRIRGGIKEGSREQILFLLRNWMQHELGYTEEAAIEAALELNAEFHPPLPEDEVIRRARPGKHYLYKNTTLLEELDLSRDEIRQMSCIIDNNEKWSRQVKRPVPTREEYLAEQKEKTNTTAKRIRDAYHRMPGATQGELAEIVGLSQQTVSRHLRQMGLKTRPVGRPRALKQLEIEDVDNSFVGELDGEKLITHGTSGDVERGSTEGERSDPESRPFLPRKG